MWASYYKSYKNLLSICISSLAGVSRSVTIVAAYIMTVTNLGWRDTLHAIRGARNCANPNFGFQRQLQDYENEGLEEVTQCIFDFEIHNKQMFTEARAFSRVTYFLFSGEPAGFFLKLT